jgi:hypothetical protein
MLGLSKWIFVCVLLAGCAGLQRDLVYRPSAPVLEASQAQLDREQSASWPLVLSQAELNIGEVVYSSKLIWVFGPFIAFPTFWEEYVAREGPLEIGVSIAAKPGASVGFDLREFMVILEGNRSLSPTAVVRWGSSEFEPAGPVMLSGGQTWRGRLQYGVSLLNLSPFKLQVGTLDVNGPAVRLPSIHFIPGKSYSGS